MKQLNKQNVLFFTRTMKMGGTENVILQLCEIIKPEVNKIVVCSCGGVNVDKLKKMGIKHIQIDDIEKKSLGTVFSTIKILKRVVKEENISIIHTHHRMAAFYVSLLRLYKRCIFINTSHNTFTNKKRLTHFAYKHGNLIACGEMVKKNLVEEFGLSDEQVTVIHNAVKPFKNRVTIDPLLKKLHDEGNFIVGNVGRLSKQKGMEYFIQAIPKVLSKHPNTKFVIAGSGEDEEKLRALSNHINVDDSLFFLGYRTDIQNLMAQFDLVVLSSLWEGLPLTPIEAFSVGKTIIATAVDGTVEIVKDGYNGFLIEPKDSNQISSRIAWCIENDMNLLEENAKSTYDCEFSFDILADSYKTYYRSVLENNR